jgi:hypothetical protein
MLTMIDMADTANAILAVISACFAIRACSQAASTCSRAAAACSRAEVAARSAAEAETALHRPRIAQLRPARLGNCRSEPVSFF